VKDYFLSSDVAASFHLSVLSAKGEKVHTMYVTQMEYWREDKGRRIGVRILRTIDIATENEEVTADLGYVAAAVQRKEARTLVELRTDGFSSPKARAALPVGAQFNVYSFAAWDAAPKVANLALADEETAISPVDLGPVTDSPEAIPPINFLEAEGIVYALRHIEKGDSCAIALAALPAPFSTDKRVEQVVRKTYGTYGLASSGARPNDDQQKKAAAIMGLVRSKGWLVDILN